MSGLRSRSLLVSVFFVCKPKYSLEFSGFRSINLMPLKTIVEVKVEGCAGSCLE